MTKFTNENDFSLAMAVWLAHDTYNSGADQFPGKTVVSATALLKPTRMFILEHRMPQEERVMDLADVIASRFGTAVHDSMERAWKEGYDKALQRLGYPQKMIDRIKINPDPETVTEDDLPVYLEQRGFRELQTPYGPIIISGQFDQVFAGELNDTKTTSVYAYINRSNETKYQLQGSTYRWIRPDIITSDVMRIQHVFTDWQRSAAKTQAYYPQHKLLEFTVPLLTLEETEQWIQGRIKEIVENQSKPEEELIRCSDEDLWISATVWKYYTKPETAQKGGRASKNFEDYNEAQQHLAKAGKGVVLEFPGKPKRCSYCPVAEICSQRREYIDD